MLLSAWLGGSAGSLKKQQKELFENHDLYLNIIVINLLEAYPSACSAVEQKKKNHSQNIMPVLCAYIHKHSELYTSVCPDSIPSNLLQLVL